MMSVCMYRCAQLERQVLLEQLKCRKTQQEIESLKQACYVFFLKMQTGLWSVASYYISGIFFVFKISAEAFRWLFREAV